ncbi:diphosphate--fructose-6-phosphate 1-phosphotransferase [Porphyromonas macacae]|uniref:Pyrophosphate--fructose 6-phosphate 1-phosphotransferase n=1 Tax=Porphyromonas macacae TaxID=28115 RepID=A0A379DGP5_9PORP|nr:diphosphate--fructose-6-phosphate 1-phosphotransferase [Porphyromonas macacae]SUB77516.1 6-phosphofructokinase [Porphyromonas macacae]
MIKSAMQQYRATYSPKLPKALRGAVKAVSGAQTKSIGCEEDIRLLFPNTFGMPELTFETGEENAKKEAKPINAGVILSGGQAPGGHNVIAGIFDGIKKIHPDSHLYGFLMGPDGLINHQYKELTADIIDDYRNTGGFDMIGSGRTKLETKEQFDLGLEIIQKLNIDVLVIIGGDDSNTNAAILAEYYKSINAPVQVIGCPKTIDGDLKNAHIETSFGFDTATKVYSEVIGNTLRDCDSAKKYWHFIKLMGRSASHIALECALQTHPNVTIISEEVEQNNITLKEIVDYIAKIVAKRAQNGENFGTVLIPEGLIEFLPSIKKLIAELNDYLVDHEEEYRRVPEEEKHDYMTSKLSAENAEVYASLPDSVARQLALDRDSHGNVQVSLIETEKLLVYLVGKRLEEMRKAGKYNGKFSTITHFFGYEGRCSMPSNFDANYCYALGRTAACLAESGVTGYMSTVRNTTAKPEEWIAGGVPIVMMMDMERRHGSMKPVIRKALVDLEGAPYRYFSEHRKEWALKTHYRYPGPIQFFGPDELCDKPSITLSLEHPHKNSDIETF